MILTVETFEKYVGQSVKDPYGRYVGVIAGFFSEIDGTVNYVSLEYANGEFAKLSVSRFEFKPDSVILVPEWKAEADEVKMKLETVRKRVKALDDLFAKGEIARHAYEEFKRKLETDLGKLRIEAKEVRKNLQHRLKELEKQKESLETALAAMKMMFFSGELSEPVYRRSSEIIKRNIEKCDAEKKDIRAAMDELEKIESAPISLTAPHKGEKPEESMISAPSEEAPLVVHVVESEQ